MNIMFHIKTWLMMKVLEHERKTKPFDGQKADNFQLPTDAGPMINNSYFFGANGAVPSSARLSTPGAQDGHSLIMRVGHRNNYPAEIFVIYVTPDGHLYTTPQDHYPADECPMRVKCVTPEEHFKIWFEGKLLDNQTKELVDCSYELDFHANLPIFSALHHSDFRGMAQAFARPKWNKEFFKSVGGDTGSFNKTEFRACSPEHQLERKRNIPQIHYEQRGHFTGTLKLGNKEIKIDLPGSRDHAYGKRDWNYMSDHIWIMATSPKGETFNFSLVDYPKVKGVFCGYSNIGYDHDESIIDYKIIQYDATSINSGQAGNLFIVDCTFTDGKTIRVTCKRENNLHLTFDNGNFYFQEGVGEVDFGGIKCRGSLEYGFNKDKTRWSINNG